MTSQTPKILTPGLYRGIEVLRFLEKCSEAVSLKQLAEKTGYPKASLLRILDTLIQLQLVHRSPDGYRALARLVMFAETGARFEARLVESLEQLAAESLASAEWFVPTVQGMVLTVCRQAGGAEVVVRARPGFCRGWNDELDCLAMLGYRFNPKAPKITVPSSLWRYDDDGGRRSLGVRNAREMINGVAPDDIVDDVSVNCHGVMRMAGAVFSGQTFLGALALAMPKTPQFDSMKSRRREALQHAIQNLTDPQQKE